MCNWGKIYLCSNELTWFTWWSSIGLVLNMQKKYNIPQIRSVRGVCHRYGARCKSLKGVKISKREWSIWSNFLSVQPQTFIPILLPLNVGEFPSLKLLLASDVLASAWCNMVRTLTGRASVIISRVSRGQNWCWESKSWIFYMIQYKGYIFQF